MLRARKEVSLDERFPPVPHKYKGLSVSSFKLRAKHGLGSRRRNRVFAVAVAVMAASGRRSDRGGCRGSGVPNNVVVFPDRDFVSIEGYQDHVGQTALLEIMRDGRVIGSAKSAVAAGDVAFEINHPGGVCWGAGTGVNVTPDIRPGERRGSPSTARKPARPPSAIPS